MSDGTPISVELLTLQDIGLFAKKFHVWPFEYLQTATLKARKEMDYNVNSFEDQLAHMTTTELKYWRINPSKL